MFRHPDAIFDIVCTLQCLYFVSAFSTYQISGPKRTRVEYMHFQCLWCLFVVIHAHIQFVTAYSIIFIETRNFDCAVFPVLYHVTCFVIRLLCSELFLWKFQILFFTFAIIRFIFYHFKGYQTREIKPPFTILTNDMIV